MQALPFPCTNEQFPNTEEPLFFAAGAQASTAIEIMNSDTHVVSHDTQDLSLGK